MVHVISQGKVRELAGTPTQTPAGGTFFVDGAITNFSEFIEASSSQSVNPIQVWATQPSVRKVVDFAARAVASTPLKVYRRVSDTDRQRVTDHPLARILRAPSPGVIPFRFWHSVIVDWLLYDRWLVLKAATQDADKPVDLIRVQAERVGFLDDGLGRVTGITIDGRVSSIKPAECLLDFGYSPLDAGGTSPMRTLGALLREADEGVAYRRSVLKNQARVPAVLERPAGAPMWTDAARERFVAGWRAYTRGGGSEGGTPILQDGMTLKKVDAFSPAETKTIEGRQLTDVEVASAYHIAPELVGAREGNYSNVEAFRQMLYRDGLGPMFVAWEQVINSMLVQDFNADGDLYVEADIDAKLRGSFEEQAKVLSTATGGPYLLRAEARARMNLPEIEGADELIVPLNVVVGGQASPQDSGTQNET